MALCNTLNTRRASGKEDTKADRCGEDSIVRTEGRENGMYGREERRKGGAGKEERRRRRRGGEEERRRSLLKEV